MSERKQQKERDKAIRHLMDYINQSPELTSRFDELIRQLVAPVAHHFNDDPDNIEVALMDGPHHQMAFGFLFELMATSRWDNEPHTTIDDFLKHRGRREGTHGRVYLRALSGSDLEFLEITAVSPGHWIEVRPYGTEAKPRRIVEQAASESLVQWDSILARVIVEGKSRRFTGSILPLRRDGASYVHARLEAIPADLAEIYREMIKAGDVEDMPVDLKDEILEMQLDRLPESAFMCWAIDVLSGRAPPELTNSDNEPVVPTRFRFPLNERRAVISDRLSAHPAIYAQNDGQLTWFKSDESLTVMGWMIVTEEHLTFETNSIERSTLGVNMIQSLLGEAVGQPIGLHENPDELLTQLPASHGSEDDLSGMPEAQDAIQKHLRAHYLKTLDEPIPMLDDESPRACAADPAKRHKVIEWLKFLENTDQRSFAPKQDFVWMWEELDLSEYRIPQES